MSEIEDRWAAGASYEAFMGRWSRALAPRFVAWLGVPRGVHWLDVGCGTGALTASVTSDAEPAGVVACDPARPLLDVARERSRDERVTFVNAGVGSLPPRPGGYGAVASLLALNFFPDPGGAVVEMAAATAPGGVVGACVWDYAGGMAWLRWFWDAVVAADPGARALDEGARFPLCRPEPLVALFTGAGLEDVTCAPLDLPTLFTGFDDYWRPFLGGTGPAPSYVAALPPARRAALARDLDTALPRAPDGTIVLTARAWAVQGRVAR